MNSHAPDERLFEQLAQKVEPPNASLCAAPSRLKARIYSSLIKRQQESGRLSSLVHIKAAGEKLCVFEQAWTMMPVSQDGKCLNLCRVCHARLLAEKMEKAPIYWGGCPYVKFQKT